MAKKITKLTTEQEARLIEFREEWRKIGLCCDPADFETGDDVIRGFYKRLGKQDPIILHFSSPAMCELAVNVVFGILGDSQLHSQLHSQLDSQLGSQLHSQLGSQLYSQLYSQLHSQLDSQLHSQLDSQLYSQLDSQLYSQLYSQLDSQLDSQLYSQLYSLKPYFLTNRWGAQHWCAWEAFYLFGHEIGVTYEPGDIALLSEWARLSQSIGWWAPWDGIVFVSDRPRRVRFDESRRLHCEDGRSVEYSDGWGRYSWHGYLIPHTHEWIITNPERLTLEAAINESNAELRRVMLDRMGWDRVEKQREARLIDADINHGQPRRLLEFDINGEKTRVMHVVNGSDEPDGSRRQFFIGAVSEATTVHEAVALSYGRNPKSYAEAGRT
jgi:hypothetical protein